MNSESESASHSDPALSDKAPIADGAHPRKPSPGAKPPASDIDYPPRSGIRYTFSSLGNRDYLFLWLGMMSLMAGIQMQMIARGYLVYEITSRPFLLGVVNAGSAIPILTLSLFGGAIADRMDRKRIIQAGQLGSMSITLAISIAIATGTVTWVHLLTSSMLQGALWSFMMPARQAIIPQIVGQENLTNGLALNAAGMSAMTLLSPAVAGTLYATFGPQGVYYVITALGFLAIVFTTMIRYDGQGPAESSKDMIGDIKEGLSYISGNSMVLLLLLMGMATALLAMPFRFLMPVFVVEIYSRGPEALGLLVSLMGLGSLAGAMAIASMGKWKRGLLLILGSFASGIGLLMIAAFPYYLAAAGIMLLLGLGDAARRTLNQTLIMEIVDDRYRGRVMSVFMMNFGLMPLGVLPAGYAIEHMGGQATVAILGAGVIVVAAAILLTQKKLREFE
jgi:MFS family permease